MRLRVGDILYCHNSCIINGDEKESLSKGKVYKIIKIQSYEFTVRDNYNERHSFSYGCYEKWFYSKVKTRKLKLKKLNESNL